MALVTFQILDGLERGDVYEDLPTPVSIGREDDNRIQLNDERVSRFHAKVQEDEGRLILTDLDSTNGTRVNGHPIHMRVLRIGDQVSIGRCLLVVGSPQQIADQVESMAAENHTVADAQGAKTLPLRTDVDRGPAHHRPTGLEDHPAELFPLGPPELPDIQSPLQAAQISDLLAYTHARLLNVLHAGREQVPQYDSSLDDDSGKTPHDDQPPDMVISPSIWRQLQSLEMDLCRYLKQMAEPM